MLDKRSKSLSENDSKRFLSQYGIPVTKEKVVFSENDAVTAASGIGFPVALKGSGEKLTHKTEHHLIHLDLRNETDVRGAYRKLTASKVGLDAVLVQQMVKGDREIVVGLTRDPQFGPCVMLGIGGIFAEIFKDVSFRVAPVDRQDAMDMMNEIRGSKILDGFRGKVPVDKEALADILVALGNIGMTRETVREIDINPIKFIEGKPVAVDALVIQTEPAHEEAKPVSQIINFGDHFPPESIGIVGVSRKGKSNIPGVSGFTIYNMLKDAGFKGRIYPINPKADEIDGDKCYPDVSSVPERLDLVILTVAAAIVPKVLEDCAKARPRYIQITTSGFSETRTEEGIKLENTIREITLKYGLKVIGPNCVGFHIPSRNLPMFPELKDSETGSVSFISQSGGLCLNLMRLGPPFGIRFSKVISYGNAMNMDADSFTEYLCADPETEIITMYLEGGKNARRLMEQVKKINPEKPVIILKSGMTESGARAAASHTGSMAGNAKIWESFFKQTGAIRVNTIEELSETASCFLSLKKTMPRMQAAILTVSGGGATVTMGDLCSREGLNIPDLAPETIEQFSGYIQLTNQGVANPLDVPGLFYHLPYLKRTIDILNTDPGIDIVILAVPSRIFRSDGGLSLPEFVSFLTKITEENSNGKPIAVAFMEEVLLSITEKNVEEFRKAGILAFTSLPGACRALLRFSDYHAFVSRLKEHNG